MGKRKTFGGSAPIKEFAGQCGLATACAVVFTLILLAGLAALRAQIDLPFSFDQPATTIIISICTLLAAYIVGRRRGKTGLVFGLACGLAVFALTALVSAVIVGGEVSGQIFTKIIALISAGGLGGLFGVTRANKRSGRKKIKK